MTKRVCGPGDWLLHFGGLAAFTATFASLPLLCAGVGFGFDILQALMIDLALFCGGSAIWSAISTRRWLASRAHLVRCQKAGASFARRPAQDAPVVSAQAKARTRSRPGPQPAGGFDALPA